MRGGGLFIKPLLVSEIHTRNFLLCLSCYHLALFLDVAKAIDTVWYSGLIYKMIKLKLPTTYIQFVLSYLRNRIFTFRAADKHSTCKQINAGVPQRSKLGSWSYKIYIHDIPTHPRTLLAIYAVDTAIMARNKNTNDKHIHL